MFPYKDPSAAVGDQGLMEQLGALENYRRLIDEQYQSAARVRGSAFTRLEAFDALAESDVEHISLDWKAFPKQATAQNALIDRNRLTMQDEYVEWATSVSPGGGMERLTFSTDFPEFYEALVAVGTTEVVEAIKSVYPGVNPTNHDLFGFDGDPDTLDVETRQRLFRDHLSTNPWNSGSRILCLSHPNNTLGALFALLKDCGIPKAVQPDAVCASVPCVPERDSDPKICRAAQQLAQSQQSFTVADPVGVRILSLSGIWKLGDREIDINDPQANEGVWQISRNGRRAELANRPDLRMDSRKITSGAQVSANLRVGVQVIAAADALLPVWARAGNEGMRQ